MLGKDTVLFVLDDKFVSAERIKNALNEDSAFLGITVLVSNLTNGVKSRTNGARMLLKARVWKPISTILCKISKKITIPQEPYLCDIMSKKKVYNMLFRYAPSAVVVSDPTIRYSIEEGIKRAGMNVRIFVYSDHLGFDYSLIGDGVSHYFVDNITMRERLRDKGVSASAIDVNPLPVEREYFEDIDVGVAKRNIGVDSAKKLCVVRLDGGMPFEVPDAVENTMFFAFDINAEGKAKSINEGSDLKEIDLYRAADYIATRFDSHTIKRVAALRRPLILICDGEKIDEEAERLVAEGKAVIARSNAELVALIKRAENNGLSLSFDDADSEAQDKVAARIKELIGEAKSQ